MGYVYIGKINGSHGLKGELKLKSDFIYSKRILKKDFVFYIGRNKDKVICSTIRKHNDVWLISFKDYENINLIDSFKNQEIYVERDDLKLGDNEFVFDDYINLSCYIGNDFLGKVIDVVDCGLNNYVFHIIGDKEILIPVKDIFIEKVILEDRIIFKDVEGLVDAN